MAHGFLDHDLLKAKVIDAHAAVFLISPHAEQALLTGLEEGILVAYAGLTPAFDMGSDLGLHELAHRIAEHFVIFIENQAFHYPGSCTYTRALCKK